MPILLDDIREALESREFHLGKGIVIVDLPKLRIKQARPIEPELIREVLRDLAVSFDAVADNLDRWQRAVDQAIAEGFTPCVKFTAVEGSGTIEVEGFDIKPEAQA